MLNPYESPQTVSESPGEFSEGSRIGFLMLLPLGFFAGGVLGGATNVVNGVVGPHYFARVMGWELSAAWWQAIVQGIFEGTFTGGFFSVILTLVIGFSTGFRCSLSRAMRYLLLACGGVLVAWFVGGVIGCAWGAIDPASFRANFRAAPLQGVASFAWVGGTIWGGQFGGLVVLLGVSILFFVRRSRRRES